MKLKIDHSDILNGIWSLIMGKVSFLISSVIACTLMLHFSNYILGTLLSGVIGGLLLGAFHFRQKMIGRMAIAGMIATPIGMLGVFVLLEGLAYGLEFLIPSFAESLDNAGLSDVIAIILMGAAAGAVFGALVYGRKSVLLFSASCAAVSIVSGFMVRALNLGYGIKAWLERVFQIFGQIDLNFVTIHSGLGLGLGFGIGLYTIAMRRREGSAA